MSRLHEFIWFEKHRPNELNDLALHKDHKASFKKFIEEGQIPHLLLEGPQGSGKTTVAFILMDSIPSVRITLNASGGERGIKTITGPVKDFASSMPGRDKIKIVFMDEADAITPDALNALKNTMETYSKNCRFILTCNHVDKIIPPIQSRCMRFTFDQFPRGKVKALCKKILDKEGVRGATDGDILNLIDLKYPDIRSIINLMQSASMSGMFNSSIIQGTQIAALVCETIKTGNMFTLREIIAKTYSFMPLYEYMMDHFVPNNGDPTAQATMTYAIGDAVRAEPTVPNRHINFTQCAVEICEALEIPVSFIK